MDYIDKFMAKDGTLVPIKQGCSKYGLFDGKRVCFIGDSITDSTYYPDEFCNLTGALEYNRGCSGTPICCTTAEATSSNERRHKYCITSRIQWIKSDSRYYDSGGKVTLVGLPTKPHLFIVYGGHNDWGYGMPFGDVDLAEGYPTRDLSFTANSHAYNLTVPTTFCGGCHFLFKYLQDNYPEVPVVALSFHHANAWDDDYTNWNTYSTFDPSTGSYVLRTKNDKTWRDYKTAYETIAALYGAKLVDLELIPFSPFNDDKVLWYKEGLHFAKPGAKKMAQYVADRVAELVTELPVYAGE